MKIIKYQSGGSSISYLPVINPVNAGAPSAPAAQEPQKEGSVVEDTVKELFKARGLKSDHDVLMNYIESGSRAIGLENVLSSKLTTIMSYINNMAVAKEEYINAEDHLQTIKGTYETAVTSKGGVFVLREGKLQEVSPYDLDSGENPLTNAELLNIRANSSVGAYNDYFMETLLGATSGTEIRDIIKEALTGLEQQKTDKQYYIDPFSEDSRNRAYQGGLLNILAGMNVTIEDLQKTSGENLIEIQTKNTTNEQQVQNAIASIDTMLTSQQRALLETKAKQFGLEGGYKDIILYYANRVVKGESSVELDMVDAATGTRGRNKTSEEETNSNVSALMSYYGDIGGQHGQILLTPGHRSDKVGATPGMSADGTSWGQALDNENNPIPDGSLESFLNHGFGIITDTSNGIYVGNQKIDESQFRNIYVRTNQISRIYLPYTRDKNGAIQPNWALLDEFKKVKEQVDKDPQRAEEIIQNSSLSGYLVEDKNGNLVWDSRIAMPFFAVNVYARGESNWLGGYSGEINPSTSEGFLIPVEDEGLDEESIKNQMRAILGTKELPYNADGTIYRGVAFLPIKPDQQISVMQGSDVMPTINAQNATNVSSLNIKDVRRIAHQNHLSGFVAPSTSKLGN